MTRPTILDSENVALLDLTPSGRAKPAWAAAAEKVVAQQMASLTASAMRRAGDDDHTAWDDVRKYVEGLESEINIKANFIDATINQLAAAEARIAELETALALSLNGSRGLPYSREYLGLFVREAWIRWAKTQPNPKPSWLVPYDELPEQDKEADRQIGEAVARWTLIGDAAARAYMEGRKE